MPKIQFENGKIVEFDRDPTDADIEEAATALGLMKRPQPPSLGPLPKLPGPPLPGGLTGPPRDAYTEGLLQQAENERRSGEAQVAFSAEGAKRAKAGTKTALKPGAGLNERAGGVVEAIQGAGQAAAPVLWPAAAAGMIAGGAPAVASAAIGTGAYMAADKLADLAPGELRNIAKLGAEGVGFLGFGGTAAKLTGKTAAAAAKAEAEAARLAARRARPSMFPPDLKSQETVRWLKAPEPEIKPVPSRDVLTSLGQKFPFGRRTEVPSREFQGRTPKSAEESARVLSGAEEIRSLTPELTPGAPFKSAKESAEAIAKTHAGETRMSREQRRAGVQPVDAEDIAPGSMLDQQTSPPELAPPSPLTNARDRRRLNERGSLSTDDVKQAWSDIKDVAQRKVMQSLATAEPQPDTEVFIGRAFEQSGMKKPDFDKAIWNLAEDGRVALARHDDPFNTPKADLDQMVKGPDGEYYVAAARRAEQPLVSPERAKSQKGAVIVDTAGAKQSVLKKREQLTDRYAHIENLERDLNIPFAERAYVKARSFGGVQGKILDSIIDLDRNVVRPMRKSGLKKDALDYATLERHEERLGIDPDYVFPGGKTMADIAVQKAAIENRLGPAKMAELNKYNQGMREWSGKLLDEAEQSGIISHGVAAASRANNQKYIPFQRIQELADDLQTDRIPVGSNAFSVAGQDVVKPLVGSEKEIADPIQSLMKNAFRMKTLIERNEIAKTMAAHAKRPEFSGVVFDQPKERVGPNYGVISYLDNGVKKQVAVPKGVESSMKHLSKEEADIITRSMAWWGKALRTGVTLWPGFMEKNLARDIKTAFVTEGINPFDLAAGFVGALTRDIDQKAMPSYLAKLGMGDDLYRQFLRSGGSFGGFYHHGNLPTVAKELGQNPGWKIAKTIANPIELMTKIGETAELTSRLAVHRRKLRAGATNQEAGWAARNATVDFEKSGSAVRVFNQMVPFVNARLQGTLRIGQQIKEAPMATAMRVGAIAGIPTVAAYFHNATHYPKEWAEIDANEKEDNLIVIHGSRRDEDGNLIDAVKIPLGEEKPFVTILTDMLERIRGNDPKKFSKMAVQIASDVSPIQFARDGKMDAGLLASSTLPPPVKALVETATKKDLYTGRDLLQGARKDASPKNQYTERTGIPFIKAAEALDRVGIEVSPQVLQHSAGTLFGHIGRNVARAAPTPERPTWAFGDLAKRSMTGFTGARTTARTGNQWGGLREDQRAVADREEAFDRAANSLFTAVSPMAPEQRAIEAPKRMADAVQSVAKEAGVTEQEATAQIREALKRRIAQESEGLTPFERTLKSQPAEVRALNIIRQIDTMDAEQRRELLKRFSDKNIVTDKVKEEMIKALQKRKGSE